MGVIDEWKWNGIWLGNYIIIKSNSNSIRIRNDPRPECLKLTFSINVIKTAVGANLQFQVSLLKMAAAKNVAWWLNPKSSVHLGSVATVQLWRFSWSAESGTFARHSDPLLDDSKVSTLNTGHSIHVMFPHDRVTLLARKSSRVLLQLSWVADWLQFSGGK